VSELYHEKNGIALISENDKVAADPLAMAIVSMMNAMEVDYGAKFTKQFKSGDVEVLRNYKRRLYQKLKSFSVKAIFPAYEKCSSENVEFLPTIPQLAGHVEAIDKEIQQEDKNKIEAKRVSALPAPSITCDPVQMLFAAKVSKEDISKEQFKAMLGNHVALLVLHSHNIKKLWADDMHLCRFSGCYSAGSIGSGTTGGGNFYCATHYRMS
jgi:hypothetical protein